MRITEDYELQLDLRHNTMFLQTSVGPYSHPQMQAWAEGKYHQFDAFLPCFDPIRLTVISEIFDRAKEKQK